MNGLDNDNKGSMGPNIASGITWATSDFFFFLIFLKPTNVYIVYIIVIYENSPKQYIWHCLGHQ